MSATLAPTSVTATVQSIVYSFDDDGNINHATNRNAPTCAR